MGQQSDPGAGSLSLKYVGDILGHFFVPRYQRGYRWGTTEVKRLLDDIWENRERPYSLQPVVVKKRPDESWELVDGQQRLTTLYLVFLYMEREGLQRRGAPYSLEYETRPASEEYLESLDPELRDTNIDFFHLHGAYDQIREWFQAHEHREEHVANKFHSCLFERVQVIWYEASPDLNSTELFTRLNVGRIPLTNAELVKALLLAKSRRSSGAPGRAHEIAAQWDAIEKDLRRPDVWAFVSSEYPEDRPTRIDLLLDTLAGGPRGRARPLFHTFDVLREQIETTSALEVWNQVQDLHALVRGWFENRSLFHKVGYLVSTGHQFSDLVDAARGCTKSRFEEQLDDEIAQTLGQSRGTLGELSYETKRKECEQVLLLMNVETVRKLKNSHERYPFERHHGTSWSLEHIHAQNAELLTKANQWRSWLQLHREALLHLGNVETEDLVNRIDEALDDLKRENFIQLSSEITRVLTEDEDASAGLHSVHALSNLALLSSGNNSALNNAVFEVKRRRILEMDRKGEYIPVCTRRVFLKYYTDADAHQIHFWSSRDRDAYFNEMLETLQPYLMEEEE